MRGQTDIELFELERLRMTQDQRRAFAAPAWMRFGSIPKIGPRPAAIASRLTVAAIVAISVGLLGAAGCGEVDAQIGADGSATDSSVESTGGDALSDAAPASPADTKPPRADGVGPVDAGPGSAEPADTEAGSATTPTTAEAAEADPFDAAAIEPSLASIEAAMEAAAFNEAHRLLTAMLREHPRATADPRVRPLIIDVRTARREAVLLAPSLEQLGTESPAARLAAIRKLRGAGDVGHRLMRRVLVEGSPAAATDAAAALRPFAEPADVDVALDRLEGALTRLAPDEASADAETPSPPAEPSEDGSVASPAPSAEPSAPADAEALASLRDACAALIAVRADDLTPQQRRRTVAMLEHDPTWSLGPVVTGIAPKLAELAGLTSDAEGETTRLLRDSESTLDEALAIPGATELLLGYVRGAIATGEADLQLWGNAAARTLGILEHGWTARHFIGRDFEELERVQLERRILIRNSNGAGRSTDYSSRWTALLRIESPGRYRFISRSDDGQRVWVNDELVINDWNHHGPLTKAGAIDLQPGLVPIRVEHFQGSGGMFMSLHWEGPGVERTMLDDRFVLTPPPKRRDLR